MLITGKTIGQNNWQQQNLYSMTRYIYLPDYHHLKLIMGENQEWALILKKRRSI